jgi:hypothetical protein
MRSFSSAILVVLLSVFLPVTGDAQEVCEIPSKLMETDKKNIFSPEQERYLGDAITEQLEKDFRVIKDEELTAYLTGVGQRVARYLPDEGIEYQFFLVDIPIVQAFAMPGGRIYVTRKLVAQAQNEDEIAGLLGHEMGHVVARQTAVDWTRFFQKVLKVSSLGDRADVYEKYHQFLENIARNPKAFRESRKERHREQVAADLIALYAEIQAGYDAEGYIQFFDRIAGTEGKTGNWFTNIFGGTKPEAKRLRVMKKQLEEIPPVCRGDRMEVSQETFLTWKDKVVAYSGLGHKEELYGVVRKQELDLPLRPDLTNLRFSPDGGYVLAQDDAGIFILSRKPWALLFHIEAPDAKPAQFTPDSRQIIIYNSAFRIERWDVEEEKRAEIFELNLKMNCLQTALSLEGRFLVCLDFRGDLILLEVSSQEELFRKKRFHQLSFFAWLFIALLPDTLNDLHLVQMRFSPDQRYFLAGSPKNQVMFDLENLAVVKPPKKLKKWLKGSFVFLDPDRIVGVNPKKPGESAVMAFPSGEEIQGVRLGNQSMSPVAKGDYVLLRPIKGGAVGVVDIQANKLIAGNKKPAFDVFDGMFVSEDKTGLVGFYQVEAEGVLTPLGKVPLPQSPLAALRAVALDEQFQWLALSQRSRGGVWNLQDGKRYVRVRGFRGAWVQKDGKLYAQFSKFEEADHGIYEINALKNQGTLSFKIEEEGVRQFGKFLVKNGPADPDKKKRRSGKDILLEIQDKK